MFPYEHQLPDKHLLWPYTLLKLYFHYLLRLNRRMIQRLPFPFPRIYLLSSPHRTNVQIKFSKR